MTLGEILEHIAKEDKAGGHKLNLVYEERVSDGKFRIRLISDTDRDAYIHCSVPYSPVSPDEEVEIKNYARAYFLSMVFNSAIRQMKRDKSDNKKKLPPTS